MSYQICKDFRDVPHRSLPFDITKGNNIIPLPLSIGIKSSECLFIGYDCVFGCDARVSPVLDIIACGLQRLFDSPFHDIRESYLGHVTTPPRSGLGLWVVIQDFLIRLLMWTVPVFRFRVDQDSM